MKIALGVPSATLNWLLNEAEEQGYISHPSGRGNYYITAEGERLTAAMLSVCVITSLPEE